VTNPKCFISYSWDSDEHKAWVRLLASELQRNGVVTYLDQWDIHLGKDLPGYMETGIREANFVLLICTPVFAEKANAGTGGVGYEKTIVTGEIFEGVANPDKFVPLLRKGELRDSLPSYLKSKAYADFRNDEMFDASIKDLLRHLHGLPKYVRPPLGPRPAMSVESNGQTAVVAPPPKQNQRASFEEVYKFAYSSYGMDKDRQGAEAFAKAWVEEFEHKDFSRFREAYRFAYSSGGMDKNRQGAEAFAKAWVEEFEHKDFSKFKEAYKFAYSSYGMDKNRQDAEAFAKAWVEEFEYKDFSKFEEAYKFAYSSYGMDMNRQGAEAFAIRKMSEGQT